MSTRLPAFFNIRFPEHGMFTLAPEASKDFVHNGESIAYDWLVTAITDVLQHERKDLCLPGNMLDSFESVLLVCEIKRIVHGDEQRSEIFVTLKLF